MTEPTRICTKCGTEKPLKTGFYLKKSRNHPRRSHRYYSGECRECTRAYMNARTAECRAYVAQYKTSRGCMDCGLKTDRSEVYDLDHRPGEEKVEKVSQLTVAGNLAAVIAECAKCDVVCANCHRIRTEDRKALGIGFTSAFWDLYRERKEEAARKAAAPTLFDLPA